MEVCMKRGKEAGSQTDSDSDNVEQALLSPYKRLRINPNVATTTSGSEHQEPQYTALTCATMKQKGKTLKVLQSQGQIKLAVYMNSGLITVHVIQARHLNSKWKPLCDAYVKMSLVPDDSKRTRCKTQVVMDSNNPLFDEKFSFELLEDDRCKRLLVSLWHRDPANTMSEFLGCMSFGVQHLMNPKREISGWFYLLTEDIGRRKHLQVSKFGQLQQLKVRSQNTIPTINKDVWWMDPLTVTVGKGKNGYGFSVVESCPVKVGRVDKASPAALAGLQKDDCIIRINGLNVSRSTASSVVKIVKQSHGKLVLDIQRPHRVPIEHLEKSPWKPSQNSVNNNNQSNKPDNKVRFSLDEAMFSEESENNLSSVEDGDVVLAEADYQDDVMNLIGNAPLPLYCNAPQTISTGERRKVEAIHRLMSIELDFSDYMHCGIERYSRPLRHCILTPKQHSQLFQNVEKLVTISQYHIKQMQDNVSSCSESDTGSSVSSNDNSNTFIHSIGLIYQSKVQLLCQAYDIYARGLRNAGQVMSDLKLHSDFQKFIQDVTTDPKQPSLSAFVYRPVQHIKELYHVLRDIFEITVRESQDHGRLKQVVEGLQECVLSITNYSCARSQSWGSLCSSSSSGASSRSSRSSSSSSSSNSSHPSSGGTKVPSPSLASLRSCDSEVQRIQDRLVFDQHVPSFVLAHEERHLIYTGEVYRWDGQKWAKLHLLLFSDLVLQTGKDKQGAFHVTENPIYLKDVRGIESQREHMTEFVLRMDSPGRNSFNTIDKQQVVFRAPNTELKFTWKSLLEQRIYAIKGEVEYFSSSSSINSSMSTVII